MAYIDHVGAVAGTPLLRAAMGESDIDALTPYAVYRSPRPGSEDLRLDRPTVSLRRVQVQYDSETGETVHRERRDLFEDANVFVAAGVLGVERGAVVTLPDGAWTVDPSESEWGLRVKLALARKCLAGMQEMRRADV